MGKQSNLRQIKKLFRNNLAAPGYIPVEQVSESLSGYSVVMLHLRAHDILLARIDELAQSSKGMRKELLMERLGQLSAELAKITVEFRTVAIAYGYKSQQLAEVMENTAKTQDAIVHAQETGDLEQLRALWREHPYNLDFAPKVDEAYTREIIGERYYVGKRATELKKLGEYQGYGSLTKIGEKILIELESKELTTEEEATYKWLKNQQAEGSDNFRKRISDAVRDYQKLQTS
jgi:hypothetical protein